ncbi:MAG: leucine--tRNA ligase [Acholeplasmatales bacterium]|jgi:leucyl-tRNA synthetase|nr:leucine--tRNA ligase [Acholeplasmatales bacterium]
MDYDFKKIELYWQKHWIDNKLFKTQDESFKPKYYVMDMFPYPSAAGLHVGHIEGYTATDAVSRFKRMQGYNVLHPMGWDAFGLPAEQYALKTGKDPREFTYKNISNFKRQIIASGKGVDWDRELATADKEYYKWTQWIFKKLYEKGLAVLKDVEVNFCPELGTVLANDEIVLKDGHMYSEIGSFPVVKKLLKQWVLLITKYANRLLEDLDLLDWSDNLKEMQRNWIGKSEGAIVKFRLEGTSNYFECFTTRPDTLYGATYCVLAPEHKEVLNITKEEEYNSVIKYIKATKEKSELDRLSDKKKTGVFTGAYAVNPINNALIPIWIADYVLPNYGTGAIMAVPAHDTRDYEFACEMGLDIIEVIKNEDGDIASDGIHYNSGIINGLYTKEAKKKIIDYLASNSLGYEHTTYKMRDWVFSRQRYWGEPFPVVFTKNNIVHLLQDDELPLDLPIIENMRPSGDGRSPLANAKQWLNYDKNGIKGIRDTNTMPQLAGSCWYYIGYLLKNNLGYIPLDSKEAKKVLDKWLPVDLYIGGTEHAVGHLLYSRFWHKFFYDLGYVSSKEPFKKLFNQGMILGPDSKKMSKSKGNVINPDDVIKEHGADTLRLYEMFMGPLDQEKPWSVDTVASSKKWLERVIRMYDFEMTQSNVDELNFVYNQTVKKVTEDYENLKFNTAISQMMIFVNEVYKVKKISLSQARNFLKLLNPLCPHLTEEINKKILKQHEELVYSEWPTFDNKHLILDEMEVVIQVNGKIRAKINVSANITEVELREKALQEENVIKFLEGSEIKKFIVIKNKIINIVI